VQAVASTAINSLDQFAALFPPFRAIIGGSVQRGGQSAALGRFRDSASTNEVAAVLLRSRLAPLELIPCGGVTHG